MHHHREGGREGGGGGGWGLHQRIGSCKIGLHDCAYLTTGTRQLYSKLAKLVTYVQSPKGTNPSFVYIVGLRTKGRQAVSVYGLLFSILGSDKHKVNYCALCVPPVAQDKSPRSSLTIRECIL